MPTDLIKENKKSLVFNFRGVFVMVDSDLSALLEIDFPIFLDQLKNKYTRFPIGFMFQLTEEETAELSKKNPRFKSLKKSKRMPLVFTEEGVAMLSFIMPTEKAINISLDLIKLLATHEDILGVEGKGDTVQKELNKIDGKLNVAFDYILQRLDTLHVNEDTKRKKRNPIGFKYPNKDDSSRK